LNDRPTKIQLSVLAAMPSHKAASQLVQKSLVPVLFTWVKQNNLFGLGSALWMNNLF
jgi:hypothetical protein